jgi:hypothetical protein
MNVKATREKQVEIPVSSETEEIVRQRLATLDDDKIAARPWPEVKRRILERKPQP